ncbi:cobalamin biosynthesis protein CobW [Candidatus Atelocyanobacterium thalassae]|uniref:Metal chaperone YciC n=1 Tax=cyanobacterium endosymbiont of Braarudosphaera bigelowii TaxID=1285375 RepID=A0ABM7U5V0_9CHRO|nr:cobalamin biosynthesis protein CobW [Candidatus Atelocyanobacterium thalassa]BDA40122.1 putative metal chaperone YciC [cyanobacterium endosymbiont of Braarudosphaera bigelowii]
MHKIPATIITGFLGSGKTTIIRHLLQNNKRRRIAVLVNEFGEVGVDGEILKDCQICEEGENPENNIIELKNGCLCCTVQEEFYPSIEKLLERRDSLDCILIETSGLALPKPLIQAFKWPEIRNSTTVDGVVTVVDCEALTCGKFVSNLNSLTLQRDEDHNIEHETPIEELFEDQLTCADLVLLTKCDLVDEKELSIIKNWLSSKLRNGVKIIACHQGKINIDILLGFNAHVEENLESRPTHHDSEEHHHDDNINAITIITSKAYEPKILINILSKLVENHEIYRIKGFIHVAHKPMRLVLQGVGNRFNTFYDRFWNFNEPKETKLVLIGNKLSKEKIEKEIQSFNSLQQK